MHRSLSTNLVVDDVRCTSGNGKHHDFKPLVIAVSAALAAGSLTMTSANAESNPFKINVLSSGYMMAEKGKTCEEGKCGELCDCEEGKCGEK